MPIQWQEYDGFDWAHAKQSPMTAEQRDALTDWVADLLGLSATDRTQMWGSASPPGRFAATVIHVLPGVGHAYREKAEAAGIEAIGVKVFKTTADAKREAQKVVPFHRTEIHRLPGLPNARVQKSLEAGVRPDAEGAERAFVVQQWVAGKTLEELVRHDWKLAPIDGTQARSILEQLLGEIVIPLWEAGTVWWDVRDANYCFEQQAGRFTLIDVDSLAAYAREILETPSVWIARDKGRGTAMSRLRRMAGRILLAQAPRNKTRIETNLSDVWKTELEPTLAQLGKEPHNESAAQNALRRFFERLEQRGCFVKAR